MKKNIIGLLTLLTISLVAIGRYSGPPVDLVPTSERTGQEGPEPLPSVLYTGGVCTTGSASGPTGQGSTGSIKVVFKAVSPAPATQWWVDSVTKPGIPSLIHNVTQQPGSPVTGFSSGAHTVYFSVVAGSTPPPAKSISVSADNTCIVYVPYN